MRKKTTVTLKHMADALQLSISTVSRALSDHPDINELTKERVKKLASDWNYVPNIFAKGFRQHKTNVIGVIVPNITHYFTDTILRGILEEAAKHGYRVIISESNNDVAKQTQMLNTMLQFVDGILMSITKATRNFDSILGVIEKVPLILFDKVSNKVPCSQIVTNEEEAAFEAIEHLINIGKKRIAIIKEQEHSYTSQRRFEGYLKALRAHNIPIDQRIILSVDDISLKQGKRMANILLSLQERPDSIFAITDSAAIGVIQTLNKFNIKIPEEIAVVGFSNSRHSTIIEPNLTTVDQPGNLIGKTAVRYLIQELQSDNDDLVFTNKTVEIKTNLIVRASTLQL